jgi:hypothetical protein
MAAVAVVMAQVADEPEQGRQLPWNGRRLEALPGTVGWIDHRVDKWCAHPEVFGMRSAPSHKLRRRSDILRMQAYSRDKEPISSKRLRTCEVVLTPADVADQILGFLQQTAHLQDVWAATASMAFLCASRFAHGMQPCGSGGRPAGGDGQSPRFP